MVEKRTLYAQGMGKKRKWILDSKASKKAKLNVNIALESIGAELLNRDPLLHSIIDYGDYYIYELPNKGAIEVKYAMQRKDHIIKGIDLVLIGFDSDKQLHDDIYDKMRKYLDYVLV